MTSEPEIGPQKLGLTAHGKIDLLRGLLAWLVVVCHAFQAACTSLPDSAKSISTAHYAILDHTINAGFVWVMGFFVISGYCIHLAVSRRLGSTNFPVRNYLIARLSRILPLYFVALAFAVIAEPWTAMTRIGTSYPGLDVQGLVGQVLMIQNLTHCYGSFTPSWSLTNEVFYYVLYGFLAFAVGHRADRPFWVGMFLCVAVGGLLQLIYLLGNRSPLVLRTGLLFGLGFNWFLGVGVGVYRDRLRANAWVQIISRCWPVVLATAFLGYHYGRTIQFAYVTSGIAFALLLIRIVASSKTTVGLVEPRWVTRLVGFVGLTSYPTYLFHFTFMWLISTYVVRLGYVAHWETLMLILVVSSLGLGALLAWFAERPLLNWRSAILARIESARPSIEPARRRGFAVRSLGKESA